MKCDQCGAMTDSGRSHEWIAGRLVSEQTRREGTSTVTKQVFTDFNPLTVFLCKNCFNNEEKKVLRNRIMVFGKMLSGFVLFFLLAIAVDKVKGDLRQLLIIGVGLGATCFFWMFLASLYQLIRTLLLRARPGHSGLTADTLDATCAKKVTDLGFTHYWTQKSYEQLKKQNKLA